MKEEFGGVPDGAEYDLHVSIEGHSTAGFLFEPSPVPEDETQQVPAQNIDDRRNFSTFYDQTIGGGDIDYNTPYARIAGSGDGTHDTYEFVITEEMLNPDAGTVTGTDDNNQNDTVTDNGGDNSYFTDLTLNLDYPNATTAVNDVWKVAVNGTEYTYQSRTGNTIATVATELQNQIDSDSNKFATYDATATGETLRLTDTNGFRVSNVTQQVQIAGTTKRFHKTTNDVQFDNATVTLAGTIVAGDTWTIRLNNTDYDYVVEPSVTSLSALAGKLKDAIGGGFSATATGDAIAIDHTNPFTVEFRQSGVDPRGTAAISGKPVQSTLAGVRFQSASVELTGNVRPHETWRVTVNGSHFDYVAKAGDTTSTVAAALRSEISGYATSGSGNVVGVSTNDAAGISIGYSITPGTAGTTNVQSTTATKTIALQGTPAEGETWSFTVDSNPKIDIPITAGMNLSSVASQLVTEIDGLTGYTAATEGNSLAIVKLTGGSLAITHEITKNISDATAFAQQLTLPTSLPQHTEWTVKVNGTDFSTLDSNSNRTGAQAATALAAEINSDSRFTATSSSNVISVRTDDGRVITLAGSETPGHVAEATPAWIKQVSLTGTAAPGAKWTITIGSEDFDFDATASTDAEDVAIALANDIDTDTSYTAYREGNTITIISDSSSPLTVSLANDAVGNGSVADPTAQEISLSGTASVNVGGSNYDATGANGIAAATDLAGTLNALASYAAVANSEVVTVVALDGSAVTAEVITGNAIGSLATDKQFDLDGGMPAGSTWTVTANGTEKSDSTSATSLATQLSTISGIQAFAHGQTVVVLKAAGGSLPLTVKVAPSGSTSSTAQSTIVTLGGSVAPDEIWAITGAGATETETVGTNETLSDIVGRLVSGLNGQTGYTASVENNKIAITRLAGGIGTVTADVTPPATDGSQAASGTPINEWSQQITLAGPVGAGDQWTWELDTQQATTYTVASDDSSLADIAEGIATAINGHAAYTATASGNVITLHDTPKSDVRVKSVRQLRVDAASQQGAVADQRNHYLNASVKLSKPGDKPRALHGEEWTVTIHGHTYKYTVNAPSTPGQVNKGVKLSSVAQSLKELIDDDFAAATVSGSTISVPGLNGATVEAKRGNGTVRAVFDIDGGEGTTSRDGFFEEVFTGGFFGFSSVFQEFVTSTTLELLDANGNPVLVDSSPVGAFEAGTGEDFGSTTHLDARLTHTFTEAGTYRVRVGTCRQLVSAPSCTATITDGVQPGISYTLNVSLENHDFGGEVTELNGKRIRIIEGGGAFLLDENGEFQLDADGKKIPQASAVIKSYDPESSTFEIEGAGFKHLDKTSVFVVEAELDADNLDDDYKAILADTYEIVLTSQPTEEVRIQVTPEDTRTFNSKFVFEDSKGQAEDKQVRVEGSRDGTTLIFTPSNWDEPQIVNVTAENDSVADGQDAAAFPAFIERVAGIRGPLSIKGGEQNTEGAQVEDPFMLAGETNLPLADGKISSAGSTAPDANGQTFATLTDLTAKHVSPEEGPDQDGMDPRMNDAPYEFLILTGPAAGVRMEVASVTGHTVTFTTDWPNGIVPASCDHDTWGADDHETVTNSPVLSDLEPGSEIQIVDPDTSAVATEAISVTTAEGGTAVIEPDGTFTYTPPLDFTGADTFAYTYLDSDAATQSDVATIRVASCSTYFFAPINANFHVIEEDQVDILDVFNRESISDDKATLTTDRLWGLGMGPDTIIAGETVPGGLRYDAIEELNVRLGTGKNDLTIETTHTGSTNITTQGSDDEFTIKNVFGHTTIDAGDGADHFKIGNLAERVDQISGLLTIHGHDGSDIADINDAGDRSGDFGTLNQTSLTGLNMPLIPAIQKISVRAVGGEFQLSLPDTDTKVTVSYDSSAEVLQAQLTSLYGLPDGAKDIEVIKRDDHYIVTLGGELAGIDQREIEWTNQSPADGEPALVAGADASVEVRVETLREGTELSLAGLQLDHIVAAQKLRIDGISGTFDLSLGNNQFGSGASDTTVTVSHDVTTDALLGHLETLYATWEAETEIEVRKLGDEFVLLFGGEFSRSELPRLEWVDRVSSASTDEDPDPIHIGELRDGSIVSRPNIVQTLTVNATDGTFALKLLGEETAQIAWDATPDQIMWALNPILNPNNRPSQYADAVGLTEAQKEELDRDHRGDKSYTRNVAVHRNPGSPVIKIEFRGEHRNLMMSDADLVTDDLVGGLVLQTRTDGIDYFDLATLNIDLGSGDDVFNIHGTALGTTTNIDSAKGDDSFQVSSAAAGQLVDQDTAPGHLDLIEGQLNLEAGTGTNSLFVSDNEATDGDGFGDSPVIITSTDITNLAPAQITYEATNGNFEAGLSIWTSPLADNIDITSVDVGSPVTMTSVYTAGGNDDVRIEVVDPNGDLHTTLPEGIDRRLRVRTQAGDDVIDASRTELALRLESGTGQDIVKGGHNDDIIHTGDGSDIAFGGNGVDYVSAITDLPGGPLHMDDEIVFGDHGRVVFNSNAGPHSIDSYEPAETGAVLDTYRPGTDTRNQIVSDNELGGNNDTIYAGDMHNVVIGGLGEDSIYTGKDRDIVFGDNAEIIYDFGVIERATSTDTTTGDDDTIRPGHGYNVVIAGQGEDSVRSGADRDFVVGDNGEAKFYPDTSVRILRSTVVSGTKDHIDTAGDRDFVIAGAGGDLVGTGSDNADDGIISDFGEFEFSVDGWLARAETTDPTSGGNDEVYAQEGRDVVLGGFGNDRLVAGADDVRDTSRDVLIGDGGVVTFDSLGNPVTVNSKHYGDGGDDILISGGGDDIAIGGMADDIVLTHSGDDIAFGDSAELTFDGGVWMRLASTAQETGGDDELTGSFGSDILVGGTMDDVILGGENGDDIVFGDNGQIIGNDGSPQANDILSTGFTLGGGDDKITVIDGWNMVIAGDGDDNVVGGSLRDWIAGDYADAIRDNSFVMQTFISVDVDKGGVDGISGRGGFDVILGGAMGDTASGHSGRDVIIGDHARVLTSGVNESVYNVRSIGPVGGADTIFGGTDDDIIVGGADADTLDGGTTGNDLIIGDNIQASLRSLDPTELISIDENVGGDDQIIAGTGSDIVIAGLGSDTVQGGDDAGADIVLGDHGIAKFDIVNGDSLLREIESMHFFHAGADNIFVGNGPDVVIAGSGGDDVDAGTDASRDVLIGDNGKAVFDPTGVVVEIRSTSPRVGGSDELLARDGNDFVIGGRGFDNIDAGTDGGEDFVLGDNGFALFDSVGGQSIIRHIESTDPAEGHDDTILAGDGFDVVVAGSGSDHVDAGTDTSRDVLIGDNGKAIFDTAGVVAEIRSTVPDTGGNDTLLATDGDDFVIGGRGLDLINAGADGGADVIVGDNGFALFDTDSGTSIIRHIETTDPEHGDDDNILAGNGPDVVVAGSGNDHVDAGSDTGRDVLIGDNGRAIFDVAGVVSEIRSTVPDTGGNDTLLATDGDDFVIGGRGMDEINAGTDVGADVVLGDNGFALFDTGSGRSIIRHIETSDPEHGDDDNILAGNGPDVVLAGSGNDYVDAGSDTGRDVLIGDNGKAIFDAAEVVQEIRSTVPDTGGNDTLLATDGDDFVIGGWGKDEIDAGLDGGADVILGDNGFALFDTDSGRSIIRHIETSDPDQGDDDNILAGDGPDVVVAGSGHDHVDAGSDASRDVLIGDNGFALFDVAEVVQEIRSTVPQTGGHDTLLATDGDDFVIGGWGKDEIDAGTDEGADVVVGDNGFALFDTGSGRSIIRHIETSDPQHGDDDNILAGDGPDVVVAGSGNDHVDAGSDTGRDVIIGDNGKAIFDVAEVLQEIRSTIPATGGNDTLLATDGDDFVVGGWGKDEIDAGTDAGADVVIGDNGFAFFDTGSGRSIIRHIETTDPDEGDDDNILAGDGPDVVVAGSGNDHVDAGSDTGRDVLVGDNGFAIFDAAEVLQEIRSTVPDTGGADTLLATDGDDFVIGGWGKDEIDAGTDGGTDVVVGDNGFALFDTDTGVSIIRRIETTDPDEGDDDNIVVGNGFDVVVAGSGHDVVDAGSDGHRDIVVGDNGFAVFDTIGNVDLAETTTPGTGGRDQITSLGGRNVILGGMDNDTINTGDDDDIVLGDNGRIIAENGFITTAISLDPGIGGDDLIYTAGGDDIVFGGTANDHVESDAGNDVVLGDSGRATFDHGIWLRIESIAQTIGGDDVIYSGTENDVVLGGTANDVILGGSQGNDIVLGDNGLVVGEDGSPEANDIITTGYTLGGGIDKITIEDGNNHIIGGDDNDNIVGGGQRDWIAGDYADVHRGPGFVMEEFVSISDAQGGRDGISGRGGFDVIIAGTDWDIASGHSGNDVVIGDNGRVVTSGETILYSETKSPLIGGDDTLFGNTNHDIILGGHGRDVIDAGHLGNDVVLGDNGRVNENTGTPQANDVITTGYTTGGGPDQINVADGINLLIGGVDTDTINSGPDGDFIVGDYADVVRDSGDVITLMTTIVPDLGHDDTISAGNGVNYVIGGHAADSIRGGEDSDYVLGDNGFIAFDSVGGESVIRRAKTSDVDTGGPDSIVTGNDRDFAIGGTANDVFGTGADAAGDFAIGDHGEMNFNAVGELIRMETTDPTEGADDQFYMQEGPDVAIGGFGPDIIVAGADDARDTGRDLVIGDNGYITFRDDGTVIRMDSTEPEIGANDDIRTGGNDDFVIGGFANDKIVSGSDQDFVFGDNAEANFDEQGEVINATATDPTLGGADNISSGSGRDHVFGGTTTDNISGGSEHDVIFGDHGHYDILLPIDQNFESIFTGTEHDGGSDTIHGDSGDDFIFGGQDIDYLFGDDDEDDITGGHNVRFGVDTDDFIEGGNHADVILGDNGRIERTMLEGAVDEWVQYPDPFPDVIRTVTRYDDIDRVLGHDNIKGDAGEDRIFAQRGDDTIDGGLGDDEIIGHLGNDTIDGGADHDVILSDVGTIIREFSEDGSVVVKRNGSWHRDVVLEDVASIAGVIDMDQTPASDPTLADKLLTTDLLILMGGQNADGSKLINDNGAWDTDVLMLDLVDRNNDTVTGGTGEDWIFGQRGDDTLKGGGDNDHIFGDNAINSVAQYTDIPKIVHTYRLIGDSVDGILVDEDGVVITTPVMQMPEEWELNNPYRLPDVHSTVWGQRVTEISEADRLQRDDGSAAQPYAAVISDVAHHIDVLPGNDVIGGDGGDDFIVADDARVISPLLTGFQSIDDASDDAHEAFGRAIHTLSTLASDYGTLNGRTTDVPHTVTLGNDNVDGGDGEDRIIGDEGLIVADFILGLPAESDRYVDAALDVQNYFGDLTHLATDFEFLSFSAHHDVLTELAARNTPNLTNPDVHDLELGNDVIDGGAEADNITGDHGLILTPVVDGQRFDLIVQETTTLSDAERLAAIDFLEGKYSDLQSALEAHIAAHHDESQMTLSTAEIEQLPPDFEFDLSIGNDTIGGSAGDDLVVGDFGSYSFPILLETPQTQDEVVDVELRVKVLAADTARWLERRHHNFDFVELNATYPHVAYVERGGAASEATMLAGNDVIDTHDGNDFVLGDSVSVSTSILYLSPETRFSERDPEFKVAFLNRRNHEMTGHYTRIGNGSAFSQDTINGGNNNDTLFGQEYNDVLSGENGDDVVHGGTGLNTTTGGTGTNDVRPGSNDRPADLLLDRLEDYQFDTFSPTSIKALEDVGNEPTVNGGDLGFEITIGSFLGGN